MSDLDEIKADLDQAARDFPEIKTNPASLYGRAYSAIFNLEYKIEQLKREKEELKSEVSCENLKRGMAIDILTGAIEKLNKENERFKDALIVVSGACSDWEMNVYDDDCVERTKEMIKLAESV